MIFPSKQNTHHHETIYKTYERKKPTSDFPVSNSPIIITHAYITISSEGGAEEQNGELQGRRVCPRVLQFHFALGLIVSSSSPQINRVR